MKTLEKIALYNFDLENGKKLPTLSITYQKFGKPIGSAPVVLVNHALTGNSNVTGKEGWWNDLIGENKIIDTSYYTVIAFNIPGNGYDENANNLIVNYKDFTVRDFARIFWEGLFILKIDSLFSIIGGSLGGVLAWEMGILFPEKVAHLIPIASDWKATDWVIANVLIQDQILNNSLNPVADARTHAMLLYRTPQSINLKFQRNKNNLVDFKVENWLHNHGIKLKNRFQLASYKLMNHLLKTNDITRGRQDFLVIAKTIIANIHLIAVDTDYFFIADENKETFELLKAIKENIYYHEIKSIHGHDAFLIEFDQLVQFLKPIFNRPQKEKKFGIKNKISHF